MAANDPVLSGVSGQVLFYTQPEPLDINRHGNLGMMSTDRPFRFAAKQHFIPLHAGEFGPAAVSYPIIFAGSDYAPLAVMGLSAGENMFISEDGLYRPGVYVPSFIRRYPFVGARDDQAKRTIVCIDRASDLWVEGKADVMLFENGEASQFTKNCIDFCSQFDADRAASDLFVTMMRDLDLFETRQATFTPRLENNVLGEPQLVAEFFAISEPKLKELPDAKYLELKENGALPLIFAHMTSLFGWERLIAESLAQRAALEAAAA